MAGVAIATTGFTQGVWGQSNSTTGVGMYAKAAATSGSTIGVEGISASSAGTAGVFNNTGGGKVLSGQTNGTEVFSVNGNGVAQVGTQSASPTGMLNATSTSISYAGLVATGFLPGFYNCVTSAPMAWMHSGAPAWLLGGSRRDRCGGHRWGRDRPFPLLVGYWCREVWELLEAAAGRLLA